MIPRHQIVILIGLLVGSIIMGVVLWNLRERAHKRLLQGESTAPTQAPQVAPAEQATLMVASDTDDTVNARVFTLPLPQNPEARARAILGRLFELYAAPDSAHPVPGGPNSIAQVFLLPAPNGGPISSSGGSDLAVVNLTGAFASSHPSGIETESLTILSICATLHANLPDITQVRFLVDGQPRATLAGNADLTRTYLTAETLPTEGVHL
ncbi:MAG: GerMN domain-containing protein [Terracidiphilus sp.]